MPSGQRVSHYKDYITGLNIGGKSANASALNESYATAMTTNRTNAARTVTASIINSELNASIGVNLAIDEYPDKRQRAVPGSPSRFKLGMYKKSQ